MSGDSDEPVYVYQARMLAEGHVTLASRLHAEFFYPWLFGQRGTRLYSQYQPGWPAVIAVGHLLGDERIALVVAAVAGVAATWFLAQQVAPGSGVFAAVLLLISPIFVVQAGLYLSYLWTAALVAGALGAVLSGVRTRRPVSFVASGALFGLALLARPFDALIVALLAGVYVLISCRHDGPALWRASLYAAIGVVPFLVLTLVYNAHVTGSPFRFPLQAAERLDTFGFGARRISNGGPIVVYTKHLALKSMTKNATSMPHWFAGGGLGLLLALAAVVLNRRRREAWLLLAMIAAFPVAYFFWWATSLAAPGAAKGLGPLYYIPAFTPLAVLAGWTLHDLARRSHGLAGLAVALVLVGSLFTAPTILHNGHSTTEMQRAKATPLTSSTLTNAVVVMRADSSPYTLIDFPFLVGDPRLDNRILYATDRDSASAQLAAQFPSRKLYQFVQRSEPGDSILRPSYIVEPMKLVSGSPVTLRFDATNSGGQHLVVATLEVDGHTVATQTLDRTSRKGQSVTFEVALGGSAADLPRPRPTLLATKIEHNAQVQLDVAFGPSADSPRADVYERRYFVSRNGSGVTVQTPGLQFHRFDFGRVAWIRENVGTHLVERR